MLVKKKRKKANVWVMCPPLPPTLSVFDPFWAVIQKLIKRKVQPSISLKERKKWLIRQEKDKQCQILVTNLLSPGIFASFNHVLKAECLPWRDTESA